MGLSAMLSAIGSFASIEAEIRAAIKGCSKSKAKYALKNLYAIEDLSRLPDDLACRMDRIEVYLGHRKSETLGERLFSQEEKNVAVSEFFSSNTDLIPYREGIEPIILKYINRLQALLLKQMSTGEKAIYGIGRRVEKKTDKIEDVLADVSAKVDTLICGNASCCKAPEIQIENIIEQTRAELPEDYINRKVVTHSVAMMDRIERLLAAEEPLTLKDAVTKNRRILLMSDSGHGKSTELQHVTCALYEESLLPYPYSLYSYCGGAIEDILPRCYHDIEPERLALIFDGFDEMLEPERREFLRRLTSFLKKYPAARVVISSRSNFCKAEVENQSHTFRGFWVYDLDDLVQSDVDEYLCRQGVDVNSFISEARRAGIENLLFNPFYLTNLVRLYLENGLLPGKNEVMEQLVQRSFELDDAKFQNNLEENQRRMFAALEKIAFAMQLIQKQAIDDSDEYQELFAEDERSLVKHSGLFRKASGQWRFIHNNFKEYLAAKYLSRLTKEEIVAFLSDSCGIRNSWVNTLSYLVNMELDWNMQSWLLEFSPNALVKFEPENLTVAMRTGIFKTLFKKSEADMLWLGDSLFSAEQLASFGCCEDSLDFLLDRINHPVNRTSQISAIELLRYFPRLFGRKQEVTNALRACCIVPAKGDEPLCYHALRTLSEQKLVTQEIAAKLVEEYQDIPDVHIRWGMYDLLLKSGQHNAQFRFFLDGIDYLSENNRIANEAIALGDGLKALSEPQSVQQAIVYLAQKHTQRLYKADEIYEALCSSAAELYLNGHSSFYNTLLDAYFFSERRVFRRRASASLRFFEETGTIENAVIDICNRSENSLDLYTLFDKQDNLEFVKQAYIGEKLRDHELFHSITAQFADDERYAEYCELIQRTDGISMPERKPRVNYEELRIKGEQQYFDALFDKDKARQLILMLIKEEKLADPTIDELREADIPFKLELPLLKMRYALTNNLNGNVKAAEAVDSAGWDESVLLEAERIIEQENRVELSPEQAAYLIQLINTQYSKGLVENAVNYNREEPDSVMFLDAAVLILTVYFDLVPEESILLPMLELPGFAFAYDGSEKKYAYLEKHLSPEIILMRIIDNMTTHIVRGLVLEDHIEYCTRLRCEDVRDCVIEAANDPENDITVKTAAVKYLYTVFGAQCVQRNILPYADEELLLTIERICTEIPNEELRTAMELQFEKEPTIRLMAHLLKLGSEAALCEYIRQAEAKMAPPEGRDLLSEGPTATISTLHNPDLLPMLKQLMDIALNTDFRDRELWSLNSSLSGALVECGCEAPEAVPALLRQYKEASGDNEHAFRFCSYTLDELQRKLCAQQDIPWRLQDAKRILSNA